MRIADLMKATLFLIPQSAIRNPHFRYDSF